MRGAHYGDLFCHVRDRKTPVNLTSRRRKLLREFESINDKDPARTTRAKSFRTGARFLHPVICARAAGVSLRDVVGILLAAGSGTRFGGDKLLAGLRGAGHDGAVGVAACRNLVAAIPTVIAVVRPGDAALAAALTAAGARVVECGNAADGMGASLACGVRASLAAPGWVVALADMPWIRPGTIALLVDALRNGAPVGALPRGRRGHPVGFRSAVRGESLLLRRPGRRLWYPRNAMPRAHRGRRYGVLRDVNPRRPRLG